MRESKGGAKVSAGPVEKRRGRAREIGPLLGVPRCVPGIADVGLAVFGLFRCIRSGRRFRGIFRVGGFGSEEEAFSRLPRGAWFLVLGSDEPNSRLTIIFAHAILVVKRPEWSIL